jgi:hypothetical protein
MADESRRVTGNVTTHTDDSKYRVMLDLARMISVAEAEKSITKDRGYWLDLMCDCHAVVDYGQRRDAGADKDR